MHLRIPNCARLRLTKRLLKTRSSHRLFEIRQPSRNASVCRRDMQSPNIALSCSRSLHRAYSPAHLRFQSSRRVSRACRGAYFLRSPLKPTSSCAPTWPAVSCCCARPHGNSMRTMSAHDAYVQSCHNEPRPIRFAIMIICTLHVLSNAHPNQTKRQETRRVRPSSRYPCERTVAQLS